MSSDLLDIHATQTLPSEVHDSGVNNCHKHDCTSYSQEDINGATEEKSVWMTFPTSSLFSYKPHSSFKPTEEFLNFCMCPPGDILLYK